MVDVIFGSDSFLVKETISNIQGKLTDVDEFLSFSSSDRLFDLNRVVEACHTVSLFQSRKCVTFMIDQEKDLLKMDEALLINLIEKPNYDVNLIIWFAKKPLAKTKIKKSIDKFAKVTDLKSLSSSDFDRRVKDAIDHYGLVFDAQAQREFIKRLDGNLLRIDSELSKLKLLDKKIGVSEVVSLVAASLENDVFEFNKALVSRNSKRAFELYQGFLELKMDPLALLGMVAYGLRNLFQVSLLTDEHMSREGIARKLSMSSYVVNLTRSDLSASTDFIIGLLNQLAQLDQDIKLGKVDRFVAFELFMIDVIRS